jgi:hypothetical protein
VDIFRVSSDAPEWTWTMHARSSDFEVRGVRGWKDIEAEAPLFKARLGEGSDGLIEGLWRFPGSPGHGLKVLFPDLGKYSVIASECPPEEDEIKAAHLPGGTLKPGAVLPYRGHIQIKKAGPEALFAAVYVPFAGEAEPEIEVRARNLEGKALGLHLDIGHETFILIHAPQPGKRSFEGLALDGRVGIASIHGGKLIDLTLGEGRSLTFEQTGIFRSTIGNGFRLADSDKIK